MNYTDTPITGKPWPIDRRTHPGVAVKSETRAACCMLWVTDRDRVILFQYEAFAKQVAIGVQDALLDFRLFAIPNSPELIASRQS